MEIGWMKNLLKIIWSKFENKQCTNDMDFSISADTDNILIKLIPITDRYWYISKILLQKMQEIKKIILIMHT